MITGILIVIDTDDILTLAVRPEAAITSQAARFGCSVRLW